MALSMARSMALSMDGPPFDESPAPPMNASCPCPALPCVGKGGRGKGGGGGGGGSQIVCAQREFGFASLRPRCPRPPSHILPPLAPGGGLARGTGPDRVSQGCIAKQPIGAVNFEGRGRELDKTAARVAAMCRRSTYIVCTLRGDGPIWCPRGYWMQCQLLLAAYEAVS